MTSLCYKCEKDIDERDEYIDCDSCESLFHLKCASVTKKEAAARKNSKCLRLYCPECFVNKANGTAEKLKEVMKMLHKLDLHNQKQIERQATEKGLSSKIEAELQILGNKINTNIDASNVNNAQHRGGKTAFSDVVKRGTVKPTVVIKPKKSQTSTTTLDDITKNIDKSKLNVCGTRNARNGSVVLRCIIANETIKVKQAVNDKLGENYDIILPKIKNPRLRISNVDPEIQKDNIIDQLKQHNDEIKEFDMNIVTIIPRKKRSISFNDIVIEVKGEVYNKLMKLKILNLPWRECQIYEHLYIKRCYKCCGFLHKSNECKESQKCSRCGGPHKFSECKKTTFCCVNCHNANTKFKTGLKTNHNALDKKCPVFMRRIESLANKIEYNDTE